ncbi:phosphoribosylglycinamide formyltransferase [Desulfobaculum bizertense]|uniref:Phosphoribosylglycinamide formyltransferase n=1 Tax=Desulfobaculum bizertense DSM 18034 TaxID=1121442 RepID=A0A1T4WIZ5_9BACT|nr:phosphoribosylglycinamide formyltransferase [Desulfobaculum bizertense]UIJ37149.1 phosphoribosylglycinamide formyltransferase [Desulfobaculum bizertense]SKA77300.1 phosphoribosylglycinamide formyltransferase-1 [Desulfobaculum bizertense DSM 18034]
MSLALAVLVSGSGSNLQAIIDAIEAGKIDAEIKLVLSNKETAYGIERAKKHGLPTVVINHTAFETREAFDRAMVQEIRSHGADVIVLAGFMRILTPIFIREFFPKIINIHPALLPSFTGAHAQRDAAGYGVRLAGCTVHFVDEIMDSGPVIVQAAVPVNAGDDEDTVGARILEYEHRIYPQALKWLAEGRLTVDGRHVHLAPSEAALIGPEAGGLVNPPLEEGF